VLRIAALGVALLLTGCGQSSYVYVRGDGQDLSGDPALYKQFETDSMTCQGEAHRQGAYAGRGGTSVGANSGLANDCMTAKGYLVVQSEIADLKRQELAAKTGAAPEATAHGIAMEKLKSSNGGAAAASRAAPAPLAADASPVFERCSRISDKAARLECFDRAATKNRAEGGR
jgi:hypothetical protein